MYGWVCPLKKLKLIFVTFTAILFPFLGSLI